MTARPRIHSDHRPVAVVLLVGLLVVATVSVWAFHGGPTRHAGPIEPTGLPGAAIAGPSQTAGDTSLEPVDEPPVDVSLPPLPAYPTCAESAVPAASPPVAANAPAITTHLHVPILMYHRIVPFADAGNSLHGLVVPPDLFAAQMKTLVDDGWRTITASQLAADLDAGIEPAPRTFVVTFDDGYDDGYQYAFPVLRQDGLVGTYYIIPGRIDSGPFLTTAHIQELAAAGMEIGDHTMDHVDVPRLNQAQMRYEIWGAADRIAQITGRWPTTFAYPFGGFDTAAERVVADCSPMRLAVTTQHGATETAADRFAAPRIRVGPGTTPQGLLTELAPYR